MMFAIARKYLQMTAHFGYNSFAQ